MLHSRYSADDRERFAEPYAATRAKERVEELREDISRMEKAMGTAISEGQRRIEDAFYSGVKFEGGYAHAMTDFRAAITDAFEPHLKAMRATLETAE